jgi:hypothetical protein
MGGINIGRWLAGGIVAGVLMWLIEGVASQLYFAEMTAALDKAGLSMQMTATVWALTVVVSLLVGLGTVFFYALARPRLGPGPKTAAIVAVAAFLGFYMPGMLGYRMIGLYPDSLIVEWSVVGLVELVVVTIVGAWVYRE